MPFKVLSHSIVNVLIWFYFLPPTQACWKLVVTGHEGSKSLTTAHMVPYEVPSTRTSRYMSG